MGYRHLSKEEIARRGEELYERELRQRLETDENIGKVLVIDIDTGDYEMDDDGLAANRRLMARHPDGSFFGLRIGYDAVEGFGGGLTRVKR